MKASLWLCVCCVVCSTIASNIQQICNQINQLCWFGMCTLLNACFFNNCNTKLEKDSWPKKIHTHPAVWWFVRRRTLQSLWICFTLSNALKKSCKLWRSYFEGDVGKYWLINKYLKLAKGFYFKNILAISWCPILQRPLIRNKLQATKHYINCCSWYLFCRGGTKHDIAHKSLPQTCAHSLTYM